eukprot:TRINITY_DN3954_c0_g1_i1.p1 TRINITY_DN3954_c0_g1~~TRINITY_DN3954_c0_g1_i1.p1  ORF type:complete len:224 (-),score=55.79 TRINITY_DN3954_c0_g1_i1:190-861(-)
MITLRSLLRGSTARVSFPAVPQFAPLAAACIAVPPVRWFALKKQPPSAKRKEDETIVNKDLLKAGYSEVRLILLDGEQTLLSPYEALTKANEAGMDIMVVAPKAKPPVCKLLDYKKHKFESKTRARENSKKQREQRTVTKEMRLSESIGAHDLKMKLSKVIGFLQKNCQVTVSINNPRSHQKAVDTMTAFREEVGEHGTSEPNLRVKGNKLAILFYPPKELAT